MEPSSSTSQQERKRKYNDNDNEVKRKPKCKYGTKCYRTNPDHLNECSHVSEPEKKRRTIVDVQTSHVNGSDVPFFLTTVKEGISKEYNHPNISRTLSDILELDSDRLIETCQFNYMFDIPWLISKYPHSARDKPLLLVHGCEGREKLNLQSDAMQFKNIDLVQAKLPIPYGTHHSKMMLLLYEHGCRVVIHTANLIQQDWYQKTQGIWMSPLFERKSTKVIDHFKTELFEYVWAYKNAKLAKWIEKLKDFDMTNAGVRIIGSTPGRHSGPSLDKWGHLKVRKLLSQCGPSAAKMTSQWPVVGQFSSIGSLGKEPNQWLTSEWLTSLSQCSTDVKKADKAELQLIFPTMENVRNSLEGYSAGGSLPFSVENATKQRYMRQFLCEWKCDHLGRSKACPHIKSYTRLSPQQDQAGWFVLTSANLSKAAWGILEKNGTQLMIRSYEIGVLFTPINNERPFNLLERKDNEYLRLPFDVPLSPYKNTDKPWVWNIRYTKEDSHGKLWNPSF